MHLIISVNALLISSQLSWMLNPAGKPIYDLMKRTFNLYIIHSTRCSVARLGWGSALHAYLPILLRSLPFRLVRPSPLKPFRHDLLGLLPISLNIVIQSQHRRLGIQSTERTSCVIWVVDHVKFCL